MHHLGQMAPHKNPLKEMSEVIKRPLKVKEKWDEEMEGEGGNTCVEERP